MNSFVYSLVAPLLFLALSPLSAVAQVEPEQPMPSKPSSLFDRVAVIGASISGGYRVEGVASALSKALPQAQIKNCASVFMAFSLESASETQIQCAQKSEATLTVAIDYLFWFAYSRKDRMASLEIGLSHLEGLSGTLLLGDIPDMSHADARILSPEWVPTEGERRAMNERILDWAKSRAHDTVILPLSVWTDVLQSNEPIEIRPDFEVPARNLLQADGLHVNQLGLWYLLNKIDLEVEKKLGIPHDLLSFPEPALPKTESPQR